MIDRIYFRQCDSFVLSERTKGKQREAYTLAHTHIEHTAANHQQTNNSSIEEQNVIDSSEVSV